MKQTNQIPKPPLSPRSIPWDLLQSEFNQQCRKSYSEQIEDFELRLSDFIGGAYTVGLNSGSSALHLALKVLGVRRGDLVVCSDFTFIGSAAPIKHLGAHPVFIDSEPVTWNMDPEVLDLALQELVKQRQKPKAIVLVHIYGNPAQLNEILQIASNYDIPVVEDAAQAFGSTYQGRKVGAFGTLGIYSFNNNKLYSALGGGALVSQNKALIDRARFLASQAKEPMDYYFHKELGYNYMISPLNASLGYAGLPIYQQRLQEQREQFSFYATNCSIMNKVKFQLEIDDAISNRWVYAGDVGSTEKRQLLQIELFEQGMATNRLWKPLSTQPVFAKSISYTQGVASQLFEGGLCFQLPINCC